MSTLLTRITAILPSLLTLGNTVCGFLAIAYVADERFLSAAYVILVAMIFDALDGQVARFTKQASDFGEQLDSLSDIITFGVAPAFLVKVLVLLEPSPFRPKVAWLLSAIFCICAVIRLARFNVENGPDESSHTSFKGLPTPAAAGAIAGLVIAYKSLGPDRFPLLSIVPTLLPIIAVLLGLLMISRIHYVHAMTHFIRGSFSFRDLGLYLLFLVLFVLLVLWHEVAIAAGFIAYALTGPLRILLRRLHHHDSGRDETRTIRG